MTLTAIDPFGYWPEARSRISGLGGKEAPNDLSYVFHTPYVPVEPGPSVAVVAFDELVASAGLVEISIFQRHAAHEPPISEAAKVGAMLGTVARTERPVKVPFEAIPGAEYAVIGLSFGECKARAKGARIEIGARSIAEELANQRSQFGRLKARHTIALAASDRPSLGAPVSQGYSAAQLDEEEFAHWAARLPGDEPATVRWEAAYILRVLEVYGRLEPGARGLGLTRGTDPVGAIAQGAGCDITAVTLRPDDQVSKPVQDKGFDFLWARSGVFDGLSAADAGGALEDLLECLRPAGLAIGMFDSNEDGTDGAMTANDLNRIALGLVASGHIVAQLRHDHRYPDATDRPASVPFGIIVRRAVEEVL